MQDFFKDLGENMLPPFRGILDPITLAPDLNRMDSFFEAKERERLGVLPRERPMYGVEDICTTGVPIKLLREYPTTLGRTPVMELVDRTLDVTAQGMARNLRIEPFEEFEGVDIFLKQEDRCRYESKLFKYCSTHDRFD